MKIVSCLVSVLLSLVSILTANERSLDLTYETISCCKVRSSAKHKMLEHSDPGHHKTMIKMGKYPPNDIFVFKFYRPLFRKGKAQIEQKTSLKKLISIGSSLGESIPMFIVSSRGFLPGEKIDVVVETDGGKAICKAMSFFPQPLIKREKNSEASISAELVSIIPTNYQVNLQGFFSGEKLRFSSISLGEKLDHEIVYEENMSFYYAPSVIGKEGGVSKIAVIRENGNKISLDIPWGSEFVNHLKGDKKPVVSNF